MSFEITVSASLEAVKGAIDAKLAKSGLKFDWSGFTKAELVQTVGTAQEALVYDRARAELRILPV